MYRKEIIYLGLYKDGSRIGNAGFLKVEDREAESRLDLKLRNIPFNINGRFPVRIHNGAEWKEINGISVQEGGGSWADKIMDSAEGLQIQIRFPGGYFLEGKSKNVSYANQAVSAEEERQDVQESLQRPKALGPQQNMQESLQRPKALGPQQDVQDTQENLQQVMRREVPQSIQEEEQQKNAYADRPGYADSGQETRNAADKGTKTIIITEELQRPDTERRLNGQEPMQETAAAYSLKEDKWEQILDSYEKIHPYGDERIYVKLEPKDFIILQSKYQHLVNNSFLLHGFYNYRYVILGKEQDYYLGVPGVFYEREKMVALMFGFEAFECPGGTARAGEFGYYLRKVEL